MASHDRLGLEAIRTLHSQLDDDADGDVDLSESDDVSLSKVVQKTYGNCLKFRSTLFLNIKLT